MSVAGDGAQADGSSGSAAISADGAHVAFSSSATNLVTDDTNGTDDVFVRDTAGAGKTTRVSVDSDGAQSDGFSFDPAISANGSQVAFESDATTLVAGDTNGTRDVFVRDRDPDRDGVLDESGASTTARVSVTSDGSQAVGGDSYGPSISSDGARVAFLSLATNLGTTFGVFVHDRDADGDGVLDQPAAGARATTLESVASDGTPSVGFSNPPSIAGNGGRVAFDSSGDNLVTGDDNGFDDVFTHALSARAGLRTLSVTRAGDGAGTVTSAPAGIDCGTVCSNTWILH